MSVVTFGEVLFDFTPKKSDKKLNNIKIEQFEANPGGAPANLAAVLGKNDVDVSFIGKVGNDQFGDKLKDILESFNVETTNLVKDNYYNTTLAFVHLDKENDRSFSFFRNPGADTQITLDEINLDTLDKADFFHFGSLSFTAEPIRSTTLDLLDYISNKNTLISYDPNLREKLWTRLDEAKWWILKGMEYADIVKVSKEELEFITNKNDVVIGAEQLQKQFELKLLIVTLGEEGCFYKTDKKSEFIDGESSKVIDTTGAGDVFYGTFLTHLVKNEKLDKTMNFNNVELAKYLKKANKAGALSVGKKGAMTSI
mgnify:CR=1 FL=1